MHRHRVLVVDDHADTADAYAAVLRAAGCEVACAGDGEEALQLLWSDGDRCVIVLDLSMPVMDGYGFRELQLTNPRLASIPVVVLTGASGYDRMAANLGLQHIFRKPLDPNDLLSAVTTLCRAAQPPSR
jgi:two-component system, OmpR family, response regulator CpxR